MEAEAKPIATFELEGTVRDFYSAEEVSHWIDEELRFAAFLSSDYATHLKNSFIERLRAALANRDSEGQTKGLNEVFREMAEAVEEDKLVLSGTKTAAYLNSLTNEKERAAAFQYALPRSGPLNFEMMYGIAGIAKFILLREQDGLLAGGLRRSVDEARKYVEEMRNDAETLLAEAGSAHRQQLVQAQSNLEEVKAARREAEEKQEALVKQFEEKIALKTAVKYWEDREIKHSWRGLISLGSFLLACLAPIVLTICLWHKWILPNSAISMSQLYVLCLPIVLSVTVLLIVIRGSYKMVMSNFHLANDASEKATMVQTYLALLEEKGAISKEDRSFLLQAIFRNAVTGLVGSEEPPTGIAGLIDFLKK
ncbi:MAG: DUF6161 domain-containing protein [Candidatus Hydrogenedentes bacterium]|nr:DUF6161 domain-containing protein [Candidatus Hydrogenedentota bacterium]